MFCLGVSEIQECPKSYNIEIRAKRIITSIVSQKLGNYRLYYPSGVFRWCVYIPPGDLQSHRSIT